MKKLLFTLSIMLISGLLYAQGGANREPAGGRTPAGVKSGPEGGSRNIDRSPGADRSGKNAPSKDAIKAANDIKAANSMDGKGKNMTEAQKNEAARQLDNARANAAAGNKKADAAHFKAESDGLKKKN